MGKIADAFRSAWRDYNTDGVPSTKPYKPEKKVLRPIGQLIEEELSAQTGGLAEGLQAEAQAREAAVADLQAANNALSDRIDAVSGTQRKDPVAFATTANISLSGTQTVDGVASGSGLRALVMNQTNAAQNGIWMTNASGAWTRASDADSEAELLGSTVYVLGGTANGGKTFGLSTVAPITVGTTPLTFVQTAGDPEGLAGTVGDLETEVVNARQSEPSLADRLNAIASDALAGRDGLYSAMTQVVADARQWGLLPTLSYPAMPDLQLPVWLAFSRASAATYVGRDGLLKSAAANAPRHEFDPDTGEYLGILMECEPTTNQIIRSDAFENAAWTKTNTTVTTGAGRAPDGTMTACKLVETTASTEHFIQQLVALNAAGKGNISGWFADTGEDRQIRLRVFSSPTTTTAIGVTFNPRTGAFSNPTTLGSATHTYSAKRYKNGWRVSYSFTLGTSDAAVLCRWSLANGAGATNYAGDGTSGVLISCFQAEQRDYATSYIRTEGAAVTRARDVLLISGLVGLIGANGGMLYIRGSRPYKPTDIQSIAQFDAGTNGNSVLVRTAAANVPQMLVTTGNVQQASLAGSGQAWVIEAEQEFTIVGAWKTDSFALSYNGIDALTANAGTVPAVTTLRIGNRQSTGAGYIGHLRHIALFSQRGENSAVERIARSQVADTSMSGQTGVFFGDSITEFSDYPARIGGRLGLAAINVGFGGCRMSPTASLDQDELSMVRLSEAIASGDWSSQIAAVASIGGTFPAILARLMAVDWSKVSYAVIFYGTNDFGGNVPLGMADDAVDTTYRGAINAIVQNLLTAHPLIKVMFATPIWRARQATGDGKDADLVPNSAGLFLVEYVDAEIEQARRHKLPVIDMFRSSGINAFNHTSFLDDGLHARTEAGNQRLADKLAGFISVDGGAF